MHNSNVHRELCVQLSSCQPWVVLIVAWTLNSEGHWYLSSILQGKLCTNTKYNKGQFSCLIEFIWYRLWWEHIYNRTLNDWTSFCDVGKIYHRTYVLLTWNASENLSNIPTYFSNVSCRWKYTFENVLITIYLNKWW